MKFYHIYRLLALIGLLILIWMTSRSDLSSYQYIENMRFLILYALLVAICEAITRSKED